MYTQMEKHIKQEREGIFVIEKLRHSWDMKYFLEAVIKQMVIR